MILTVTANPAIDKVYFVDEFVMGNVYRPKGMSITAGGKGLNVSRVASILGESVTAMGFIGGGAGDFIRNQVRELGIEEDFTQINGETRTCINISDNNGLSVEILESGPTVTKEDKDTFLAQFKKNVKKCKIVCVSGSLPKGLDSSFYCQLIEICKLENKPIIVDTSGSVMADVIEKAPSLIKPNFDELAQLIKDAPKNDETIKEFLGFLKEKGITVPFVTLGKNGAVALIDGKYIKFNVPKVSVKNAVGSGDSTVAGVAVGICKGLSMEKAIRLGMAVGVTNTQFKETGMVTAQLVEKYYNEITISEF